MPIPLHPPVVPQSPPLPPPTRASEALAALRVLDAPDAKGADGPMLARAEATGPVPARPIVGGRRPTRRIRSCVVSAAGQATTEYALVLLGAAAIALLLAAWAARSGAISKLFDAVVDELIGKIT